MHQFIIILKLCSFCLDNSLSFGVSRLLKGGLQLQDASLSTKECGTDSASFEMDSSTMAINNNNSEV